MNRITFDPSEGPTSEQQAAETAALEQGEKLAQAAAEDKARLYENADAENEDVSLIGGKFKSQEDLLKAYQELQKKMSSGEPAEEEEEAPEAPAEEAPVEEEAPVDEGVRQFYEINKRFEENGGQVSDEDMAALSAMSSEDLLKTYFKYHAEQTAAQKAAIATSNELQAIRNSVGGDEAYAAMIEWAGKNLSEAETDQFNAVIGTNNAAAIGFAVESLNARFRAQEGYEAPLVTGKKAASSKKVFRSQAELARAIADPRYQSDPAYRMDVEEKLARSGDLL